MSAEPPRGKTWARRALIMVAVWCAGIALMAAAAVGVLRSLEPPSGPTQTETTTTSGPPTTLQPGDDSLASAGALPAGTCTSVLVRTDDGGSDPVVAVDCADAHTAEVIGQLPPAVKGDGARQDACAALAAAVGVPVDDLESPVPFRVGAFETASGTVECTVSTPEVRGSITTDGFASLAVV